MRRTIATKPPYGYTRPWMTTRCCNWPPTSRTRRVPRSARSAPAASKPGTNPTAAPSPRPTTPPRPSSSRGLRAALPHIPVIAEEEIEAGHVHAVGHEYWLVDPLDGTPRIRRGPRRVHRQHRPGARRPAGDRRRRRPGRTHGLRCPPGSGRDGVEARRRRPARHPTPGPHPPKACTSWPVGRMAATSAWTTSSTAARSPRSPIWAPR